MPPDSPSGKGLTTPGVSQPPNCLLPTSELIETPGATPSSVRALAITSALLPLLFDTKIILMVIHVTSHLPCCQEWDMDGNPVVLDTAAVQSDGGGDDGGGDNGDDDVY